MQDVRLRVGNRTFSVVALYAIFISVCYILPVIKYSVPYMLLGAALLLTYVLSLLSFKIDSEVVLPAVLCACGLFVMQAVVVMPGNVVEGVNECIRALRYMAPGILFLMIDKCRSANKRMMFLIFAVIVAVILFVCYKTLIKLDEDSMIARILAGGSGLDEEFKRLRFENIGGFEFSYASGFLCIFAFFLVLDSGNKLISAISLAAFLYLGYYIVRAQYMTLLILVAGTCAVYLYARTTGKKRLAVAAVGIAAIFFLPALVESLGGGAEENTDVLMEKFDQFQSVGEEGVGVLGRRPTLYLESFLNFLKSPVWGHPRMKNGFFVSGLVDSHSSLLGYLQNMGIIGGILFYYPLIKLMKACYRRVKDLSAHAGLFWKILCASLFVLSVLNPIQYCFEFSFMVFLCIPCGMCVFLRDKENGQEEESEEPKEKWITERRGYTRARR